MTDYTESNYLTTWSTHLDRDSSSTLTFHMDLPPSADHPLFVEMAHLVDLEGTKEKQWKEAARWVKYEEDIEEGGHRWSKPFVSAIHANAVLKLQSALRNGLVYLNFSYQDEEQLSRAVVDGWVTHGLISEDDKSSVLHALLKPHVHLYESHTSIIPEFLKKRKGSGQSHSSSHEDPLTGSSTLDLPVRQPGVRIRKTSMLSVVYQPQQIKEDKQKNTHFLRKIPKNSECGNIMVGPLGILDSQSQPLAAIVRLREAKVIGNFAEVPLPTRFVFILLTAPDDEYLEIGRAMGTLLTADPEFRELAYKTTSKEALLKGIDNFLQSTSILPPAVWDPSIRLEPHVAPEEHKGHGGGEGSLVDDEKETGDNGLERTGKLFGGLYKDLKRKIPWYPSDFTDSISLQVLATWLFMYFACLAPMVSFGALMGEATHHMMGTMETIVAGCVCGIGFALFAGQPLLILGSTGPVLVFEKILVNFAESNGLDYLELRLWVGIWIAAIILLLVAFEASVLVKYITRFTEDNFATLIACIFMYEAIKNVIHIKDVEIAIDGIDLDWNTSDSQLVYNNTLYDLYTRLEKETGNSVFLMSLVLFFATFFISFMLKEFRMSGFFPTWFRYLISDFSVILAILLMTLVDYFVGFETPKLDVPQRFEPTSSERGWLISPFGSNPLWSVFAAGLPALLATILIFMDQQITAVIVNKKDHKLQKGSGYNLDLFILALLIVLCSVFGLPWFVAATVESLTNVNALKMESDTAAPGEKPIFLGVREQRVSNLLVFITVGLSVFLTPVLKNVPMPVLYGVFLYMGFSALMRMDLFHRILLLFMPLKYQPDHSFLRQVPIKRVHLFTTIQVLCLAVLWVIKSIPVTAIGFPVMLVVMIIVRKSLDYVFTQSELLALDDLLPSTTRSKREQEKGEKADEENPNNTK